MGINAQDRTRRWFVNSTSYWPDGASAYHTLAEVKRDFRFGFPAAINHMFNYDTMKSQPNPGFSEALV